MLSVEHESQFFFFFFCGLGDHFCVGKSVRHFDSGAALSYQATLNNSLEPNCCLESDLPVSTLLCTSHLAFLDACVACATQIEWKNCIA